MKKWMICACDPKRNYGAQFILLNKTCTRIKVNRRMKFDPGEFLSRLDNVGFPLSFTDGIEYVNFTVITDKFNAAGYYVDNNIMIDISSDDVDFALETFMHEVGHYVDENENISGVLQDERLRCAKHLEERFSSRTNAEYLAIGFEKFYSEKTGHRKALRKHNPMLYKNIMSLHRKYSKM